MRYVKAALVVTAAVVLAVALAQPARADVSFDFAYSNLSQHGSWLVSGQYGRVWQPREYTRDWNPYYDGHWAETDMGATWVSDYEWGALPYHYGTWVSDPRYGWVWIPGEVWAPSWVVFRSTPEYIGWAPVPPGFSVGVSIEFGAPSSFTYVSSHDFLAPRLRESIIPRERTSVFINNTTIINNISIQNNVVINRGPDVRIIEKATGQTIRQQPIEQVARVAPFANVTRAQLAVAPDKVKGGLRVAQPVPESHPLPVSDNRGRPGNQGQASAPAALPTRENAPKGRDTQTATREAAPVTPSNQAEVKDRANGQRDAKAQADAAAQQQQAKTQQNDRAQQSAKAQSDAAAQQQQQAKTQQNDRAQQNAKAQLDATAQQQRAKAQQTDRAQQNAKAQSDATAQQQRAKAQQNDRAQQTAKPQDAAPQQHAAAQQSAKAQADARAKASAKAKKDQPEKKDTGSEKGTTEEPKQKSGK